MSVKVDGKYVFTKEMANLYVTEVIECPDCGFEFASKHEIDGADGCYDCPCCNEANLSTEIHHLKEKIEQYEDALREIDTHIRATGKPIPYIIETLKKTLSEYKE